MAAVCTGLSLFMSALKCVVCIRIDMIQSEKNVYHKLMNELNVQSKT